MKKLRKQAKELLHAANKVYHYRRDVIEEHRLIELEKAVDEVAAMLKDKEATAEPFEAAQLRLDALLRKIGGKIYPKTFWSDNFEVILVAAILVIGVRTFFFQPFIIPTNSMYPTYSGMNSVIYTEEMGEPSLPTKLFRLATLGARHRSLVAEDDGPVQLLVQGLRNGNPVYSRTVPSKVIFKQEEYQFLVGNTLQTLRVPQQFDISTVFAEQIASDGAETIRSDRSPTGLALQFNKQAVAGQDLLRFDVTLGDALFVDRFTYHFRKPRVGEPFVFRTDEIQHEIAKHSGDTTPKYYIKRIAGAEGETLEIRDSALLVDGEPRTEVEAFERNARQEGEYPGYINQILLSEGRPMTVPEDSYVSLGDNSASSLDSRYWGFVPDDAVIGKAIFIYFPFTKRWGVAE
ncbi:MAG: signal peptidase I [Coraliomargarita sp.]